MSLGKFKFPGSRKQSTASSGNSDTTTSSSSTTRSSTPTNGPNGGSSSNSSRSSKTSSSSLSSSPFSWFRSPHRSKRRSTISRDDPLYARLHKPFTPQNLEHQKLLNAFEWNFDNDHCRRRRSSCISPCASRDMTVDDYADECGYGYAPEAQYGQDHMLPPKSRQDALSDSFGRLSTREGSSENTA
ncbi:hypothetical protein GQX73_g1425 [Xylaria multiplex]|uniref:Uncharacterized protein n=1 Tax=Xylaria multiplex TaxID=323545 RepID=A0A7C8IY94_9PEZI|nr:hypothetical protein GQX73_g1425 [Xylaria multiplex]